MGLDIKLPIGLMFSIFGIILTIFGLCTLNDTALYERSLGINVNLWSGIFMMIFGGIMLTLYLIKKKQKPV
ncbi:MAG: hypothetical protein Q8867_10300 [Bacteroidota bacterium]|nr:hypothetical protein [Bacteroidota bacterium]